MREIKFRAFCDIGEENKMLLFSEGKYDNGLWFEHVSNHIDEYLSPLMQYTGLKDKNGKEIYEGDILEFKNELGKYGLYKIFYKEGGLCFNVHQDDFYKNPDEIYFYESCSDMQSKGFIVQCEIIGNIYENPELLNE